MTDLQVYIEEACTFIDTIDRRADFLFDPGFYTDGSVDFCKGGTDEPGKRVLKVGLGAEVGFGRLRAGSSIFVGELRGPNAQASIGLSQVAGTAVWRAELLSAKCSMGPFHVKGGAGFDTGGSLGFHGVEAKFMGCGFTLGRKNSLSFFGSEVGITLPVKMNAYV